MDNDKLDLSNAPLLSHLLELRSRLLLCLLFFSTAFLISYYFAEHVYAFLLQPLYEAFDKNQDRRLIYTGLHEAFFTYLKLAFCTALFFTLPLMLIQLWRFIAPGLYHKERKSVIPLFIMTPVLFTAGAALAYYLVMPLAWTFFISFETSGIDNGLAVQLEARVSEYLGLVIKLILAFGMSFELPILLLVLAQAGIVSAKDLVTYRKHAVVITFLFAAFITPPDLISQIALGAPILLLYEFSILLIRCTGADKSHRQRTTQY